MPSVRLGRCERSTTFDFVIPLEAVVVLTTVFNGSPEDFFKRLSPSLDVCDSKKQNESYGEIRRTVYGLDGMPQRMASGAKYRGWLMWWNKPRQPETMGRFPRFGYMRRNEDFEWEVADFETVKYNGVLDRKTPTRCYLHRWKGSAQPDADANTSRRPWTLWKRNKTPISEDTEIAFKIGLGFHPKFGSVDDYPVIWTGNDTNLAHRRPIPLSREDIHNFMHQAKKVTNLTGVGFVASSAERIDDWCWEGERKPERDCLEWGLTYSFRHGNGIVSVLWSQKDGESAEDSPRQWYRELLLTSPENAKKYLREEFVENQNGFVEPTVDTVVPNALLVGNEPPENSILRDWDTVEKWVGVPPNQQRDEACGETESAEDSSAKATSIENSAGEETSLNYSSLVKEMFRQFSKSERLQLLFDERREREWREEALRQLNHLQRQAAGRPVPAMAG